MKCDKCFFIFMIFFFGMIVYAFTADARNRTYEQRRAYNEYLMKQANAQGSEETQDDYEEKGKGQGYEDQEDMHENGQEDQYGQYNEQQGDQEEGQQDEKDVSY